MHSLRPRRARALLAACVLLSLEEAAWGSELRTVFKERRCLTDQQPVYPFDGRKIVFEVNPWDSHEMVTTIAAIILREKVGFDVDLNPVNSQDGLLSRLAKEWSSVTTKGDTVEELLAADERFGYVNMEGWAAAFEGKFIHYITEMGVVDSPSMLGYTGRSGWFVPDGFVDRPEFAQWPEFYRAYDGSTATSQLVLDALAQDSSAACTCCCETVASCFQSSSASASEAVWCPTAGVQELPAVLSLNPYVDAGFTEEVARSFSFAVKYVSEADFFAQLNTSFSQGAGQLAHMWRPSVPLARAATVTGKFTRVLLRSEACGEHRADGSGTWSCDFPEQALTVLTSTDVKDNLVAQFFFSHFSMAEGGNGAGQAGLAGGGIDDLMRSLASLDSAGAEQMFDTACAWIQANQDTGHGWMAWVKPRDVPFFADTIHSTYPWPALLCFLLACCLFVLFVENPWLWTTLSHVSIRRIFAKNKGDNPWRTDLEVRLKEQSRTAVLDASQPLFEETPSGKVDIGALPEKYWLGLADLSKEDQTSRDFWDFADAWEAKARHVTDVPDEPRPPHENLVHFADHTFACFQDCGTMEVVLRRRVPPTVVAKELVVRVVVEECGGGAKAGVDFEAGEHEVCFPAGADRATLKIAIHHHADIWANTYWFQARISSVPEAAGSATEPAAAKVMVLDMHMWPANLDISQRTGYGVSLMRYFIKMERQRRGAKYRKTMIAMLTLPVHNVLVSTLVQKIIVDLIIRRILDAQAGSNVDFDYSMVLVLVAVQFVSLGINRWADVVQTRNRGRTGGIRQVHRLEMLRKFLHLEHSEHWEASEAHWLYSAIYDADVITGHAYFQVFVFAQSVFALFLSLVLVIYLAIWSVAGTSVWDSHGGTLVMSMVFHCLGILVVVPVGLCAVWKRRKLLWVAVVARREGECNWFKLCTWAFSNWRQLYGFVGEERLTMEKALLDQNKSFVNKHWDARDSMNDTLWMTQWLQGVAYCVILMFGTFALIDSHAYGLGMMEVGTFYALCKIYLTVGKYVGRLSTVFVKLQRAVVSVREIAALCNQRDQSSWRRQAMEAQDPGKDDGAEDEGLICFRKGCCHIRPDVCKVGSIFAELAIQAECKIPLGRLVHVSARNERVLRTFLGLCSKVIFPTHAGERESQLLQIPPGLQIMMLPQTPAIAMSAKHTTVIDVLKNTCPAHEKLCRALAQSLGLEPDRASASLGPGSAQVLTIVRALLLDPDVLCGCRPLSTVPPDVRSQVALMLRMWQSAGGLPKLAEAHGLEFLQPGVYRAPRRTLILGNSHEEMCGTFPTDVDIQLDDFLALRSNAKRQHAEEL